MSVRVACYPRGSERGADFYVAFEGRIVNVVCVMPDGQLEARVLDPDERQAWRHAVRGDTRNRRASWV